MKNHNLFENPASITEYFALNELDSFMINELNQFMDEYDRVEHEYLSASEPSEELSHYLQKLTQPINAALTQFDVDSEDKVLPPAVEFIRSRMNKQKSYEQDNENQNEPYVRKMTNKPMNGFTNYIIVLILTSILGIMLGALLFFINN